LQDRVVVGLREHYIDRVAPELGLAAFEQVLLRGAGLGGDLLTAQAEQVADRVWVSALHEQRRAGRDVIDEAITLFA
jgi:hypothetical protein